MDIGRFDIGSILFGSEMARQDTDITNKITTSVIRIGTPISLMKI